MRLVSLLVVGAWLSGPASASEIGLPVHSFVQTWTALPTGHFTQPRPDRPFKSRPTSVEVLPDAKLGGLLDDAFASARDDRERRSIALSEMMAPWDQEKRTAFQRLRDAEAAYAGNDEGRQARFVATLARVMGGTGRSVATDGSGAVDLDKAYAAALAPASGDARLAREAEQERWRKYDDAFAAFADLRTPGSAAGVKDELARQRVNDLAMDRR